MAAYTHDIKPLRNARSNCHTHRVWYLIFICLQHRCETGGGAALLCSDNTTWLPHLFTRFYFIATQRHLRRYRWLIIRLNVLCIYYIYISIYWNGFIEYGQIVNIDTHISMLVLFSNEVFGMRMHCRHPCIFQERFKRV